MEKIMQLLKKIYKEVFKPKFDGVKTKIIEYSGIKIKIVLNPKNGYVDKYIFNHGIYEKEILDTLRKYTTPESVFLDIGANIGQHSLVLSNYCKEVHAFEPIQSLHSQLQESIKKNNFKNIFAHKYAIGAEEKTATIFSRNDNFGASSIKKSENTPNHTSHEIKIASLKKVLGEKPFHLVKIDVEGFEFEIIHGNLELFKKHKPVIVLEFTPGLMSVGHNSKKEISEEFFNLCTGIGYKIYSLNHNHKPIKLFTDVDCENQDNWLLLPN